jgi:hypothetical protein
VDTVYLASGPGKIAGHVDGDGQHASLPGLLHLKANCIDDVSVQHNFVANCIESPWQDMVAASPWRTMLRPEVDLEPGGGMVDKDSCASSVHALCTCQNVHS